MHVFLTFLKKTLFLFLFYAFLDFQQALIIYHKKGALFWVHLFTLIMDKYVKPVLMFKN